MTSMVLYSAQYRQSCTRQAFEQFGALDMHNPDDKHPSQPAIDPQLDSRPARNGRCENLKMTVNTENVGGT